jgi:FHA domain
MHTLRFDGSEPRPLVGETITVGRTVDNDIRLDDESVSNHHARLDFQDDQYVLVKLGSMNGTEVNGQRITQARLVDNDRVRFGSVEATFSSPATVVPPDSAQAISAPGGSKEHSLTQWIIKDERLRPQLELAALGDSAIIASVRSILRDEPGRGVGCLRNGFQLRKWYGTMRMIEVVQKSVSQWEPGTPYELVCRAAQLGRELLAVADPSPHPKRISLTHS